MKTDGLYAAMEKNEKRNTKILQRQAKPFAAELVLLVERIVEASAACERAAEGGSRPDFLAAAERRDMAIYAADDFLSRYVR
jgi:hypothetical protein